MIQKVFRHFQCESASCITYLSANGGGRERKATYWGVESCWGTCTRKYSQVNIYSKKHPEFWQERSRYLDGKSWKDVYDACCIVLFFCHFHLFDPIRSIKHLRMTFDPSLRSRPKRSVLKSYWKQPKQRPYPELDICLLQWLLCRNAYG